jgi:hypothetical protein
MGDPAGLFSEGVRREAEDDDQDRPFPESPVDAADVSSSSDEHGADSDSDEEAENVEGLAALSGLTAGVDDDDAPADYEVWHHASTLTRHLQGHVDPTAFLCGRRIGEAFVSGGSARQPLCRQCVARA